MGWLKSIGKAASKLGKAVVKVAPIAVSFVPGVGGLAAKALSAVNKAQSVKSAFTQPSRSAPPIPVQLDPYPVVMASERTFRFDEVKSLVTAAYQRGRADNASGK